MPDFYAVAGHKLFIGGVKAATKVDFVAADFTSQTWVEIDGWTEMGELGDESEVITQDLINRGRTAKLKGSRDAGDMENQFVEITTDPGQIALLAAEKSNNEYAFKIEGVDRPATGASPKPSMRFFTGLVTSARVDGGESNDALLMNATIAVTSNIVRTAASAT